MGIRTGAGQTRGIAGVRLGAAPVAQDCRRFVEDAASSLDTRPRRPRNLGSAPDTEGDGEPPAGSAGEACELAWPGAPAG